MTVQSSRRADPRCGRFGFTLFELMIVMGIIIIILAIGAPLFLDNLNADTRLDAAADMVKARWADCRTQAIDEGRSYRFAVIPNSGKFRVEPFDPDSPDSPVLNTFDANGIASLVIVDELPSGVRFATKDNPINSDVDAPTDGNYVTVAVFQSDGSALEDVEISFGSTGGRTITLKLRGFTGTASSSRSYGDGK